MKISELNYEVTPISLENFKQRSFEILFDVFNSMNNIKDELVHEYVLTIGNEELYESLKYHYDAIYSSILTKNYDLIKDFFIWKYSVYVNRGINVDCFLKEYELWKEAILNHLYASHASEINIIYDYLILNHENFKINALETKRIDVKKKHKELFELLLLNLLKGQKSDFYKLIENNLNNFDNNIFLFIEELINPLMYKIGQMWQLNELSVAKEHLASSIIDEVINFYIKENFFDNSSKFKAIISTVGDETHNLGIRIVGKYLESCGFNVKNLSSKISNKELINSRRAIIILRNRIENSEPDPLGLTSIRIYLTKEENITKINFTFIWRTVEAIVGFPYSAYGSIRYAEEFLNKLKELLPQGVKIHFGDLTYIAQTLHIFQDTYSENIAKNIIDEVTYY